VGDRLKIDPADRTPRETLEERLETTPGTARCFAQGSSLMCWLILEIIMGTAHGAEELGLCPHGHACQAGARGPHHRVMPTCRIWPYSGNGLLKMPAKIFCEAHNFISLDFDKLIFACCAWINCGTRAQMRITVSRE
jgi:hypothetical protein